MRISVSAASKGEKMANDWNYVPVFKENSLLMAELSNAEFGMLVRAAMCDVSAESRPDGFTDIMFMSYKVLMSQVERVYRERESRIKAKKERAAKRQDRKADSYSAPKDKYQPDGTDPEEALRIALERSFGEEEG